MPQFGRTMRCDSTAGNLAATATELRRGTRLLLRSSVKNRTKFCYSSPCGALSSHTLFPCMPLDRSCSAAAHCHCSTLMCCCRRCPLFATTGLLHAAHVLPHP